MNKLFLYIFLIIIGSAYSEVPEKQEKAEPSKERKRDRLKRYAKKIFNTTTSEDTYPEDTYLDPSDAINLPLRFSNKSQIIFDDLAQQLFSANTYKRDTNIQSIVFKIIPSTNEIETLAIIVPNVKSIDMSNIFRGGITSYDFSNIISTLSAFKNLASLNLNNNKLGGLLYNLKQDHFKNLESIEISQNNIDINTLKNIISFFKELKKLDISNNTIDNPTLFVEIQQNLKNLEYLNIANCFNLENPKLLSNLKDNLQNLQRLNISSKDLAWNSHYGNDYNRNVMGKVDKKMIIEKNKSFLFIDGKPVS